MISNSRRYDINAIRDLLLAAFSVETLYCLFEFTDNRRLKPLVQEFSMRDGLRAMVYKTIIYCQRHDLLSELLLEIEKDNPRQYKRYKESLQVVDSESDDPDDFIRTLDNWRQRSPGSKAASERLVDALRELILHQEALQEWKELHHRLQNCLVTFGPFLTEVELVVNTPATWDRNTGRRWWSRCRVLVDELGSFAKGVEHIAIVEFQEGEEHLRGDPWIVEIVRARHEVEQNLDGHSLDDLRSSAVELFDACDRSLRYVDGKLRRVAAEVTIKLHSTLGSIEP